MGFVMTVDLFYLINQAIFVFMLLSQTGLEQYRGVLLKTLESFIRTCGDNSLRWWMAFGSAIGTVRHHGFIPWDDDIDVFMPRPDYEKLKKLEVPGVRIEYVREGDGDDFPFPYVKFCDGNSTIWERQMYPSVFGVFIDVFPLDEAGEGDSEAFRQRYRRIFHRYKRSQRVYPRGSFLRRLAGLDFRGAFKVAADGLWHSRRLPFYKEAFLACDREAAAKRGGDFIVYGTSSNYRRLLLPRSVFENTVTMKFEGLDVNMAGGYDTMLRLYYGDYMQLPPYTARLSEHYHYFIDLDRRLTLDEAIDLQARRGMKV